MRFFNTAGPIQPDIHYHLPPSEGLNREESLSLIAQRKYFVLHTPPPDRQDFVAAGAGSRT